MRTVRLPLNEPFETSFGSIDSRLIFLVSLEGQGLTGWGEVVAAEEPRYSYETVGTAWHVIRDYLAPAMLSRPLLNLAELSVRFAPFRGHNMAKAGLELAYMDLLARTRDQSLCQLIGGTRSRIPVGVSLGIQSSLDQLLERVDRYLALGYQRIKLKIKPGWDLDIVREVRRRHPAILLSVDANCAYLSVSTKASPARRGLDRLSIWAAAELSISRSDGLVATHKRSRFMTCAMREAYRSGAAECWNPASVARIISRSRVFRDSLFRGTSRPAPVTSREI